jgi:hypothetical protein
MKKKILIKVEWVEDDGVYVATSDDLVGLVIEEDTLEACCKTAQVFAYDMIGQYEPDPESKVELDFEILDKASA